MFTPLGLTLALLSPQGAPLRAQPAVAPVVLESPLLQVKLNRTGILHSVVDKAQGGHSFTLQATVPWEVDVRHVRPDPSGDLPRAALLSPATTLTHMVSNSGVVRSGSSQITQYRWDCAFQVPNDSATHFLSVSQWYELGDGDAFVQTWGEAQLASPTLSIRDLRFALGIRDDPATTEYATTSSYLFEATREPARNIGLLDFRFALQNVLGSHWNDLGYFLYLMSDDPGYGVKSAFYAGDGSVFTTTVRLPAVNQYLPGNTVKYPHRLRIGVGRSAFRGEEAWIGIADAYRSFLEGKGSLAVPVHERTDIPDAVKTLDLMFYSGDFAYPLTQSEMNAMAMAFRDAKNYYGAASASLLMWETGASPFMTYTPRPTQVAFHKMLRSVGEILPCLYTAFAMASVDDPGYPSIKKDVNYLSHLRQEPVVRGIPGNLAAVFDPHSTLFTDWMVAKLEVFNAQGEGTAGVYVDNTHDNGAWYGGLWNPALDNVRKYGVTDDTIRGPRGYYSRITAAMQAKDPDFFAFHESSIPSSHFVGGPAVQSTTGLQFASWAHPTDAQSIVQNFHFLERVFGGYNIRQGAAIGESNLRILEHMPYILNKAEEGTTFDIHDDFDAVYAVGVLQGGGAPAEAEYGIRRTAQYFSAMPNYRANHPMYNQGAPDWDEYYRPGYTDTLVEHAAFLRELVGLRRVGRKYFHGQWQPLPPTGAPTDTHVFRNLGTGKRTGHFTIPLSRVVGAAWKAWDGDLGLFYANHHRNTAREAVVVDVDFGRYGLETGVRHRLYDLATDRQLGSYTSSFRYPFDLARKKARGFYVRKAP